MFKAYCTYRIKVTNRERVQVEKWNSLHQSLGDPSGTFRYLEKLNELAPLLTRASNNELNSSNEVRRLGEGLFDILFDDGLCRDFVGFYQQVVHQDRQLLRIELVIDEQGMPEVATLPWEFLCLPERENLGTIWLSTAPEVVFSRRRAQYFAAQPIQLQKGEKLRIALIVASPPDLPAVSYQPIQESLKNLAQEKVDLVELLPALQNADPGSIDETLSQAPHIVHFIGYCGFENDQGQEVGVFLVDTDLNQAMWVEADYFSELLNQHRPGLVILQAGQSGKLSASRAFTGVASRVLQQNIPVIVAMQYEVSDTVSTQFPCRFYKQLAEGDPVDIAAQYGRRAISLSPKALYKKRDFATPVIYMRVEDGYLFEQYEEESPELLSSIELKRRLEAAMPRQCQVEQPTEVRVMVALYDSPGLRATLPDYTESGDLIEKNDVVQNDVPLEFPVDSKTQKPLPINVFVSLTVPGFKVEHPAKSIRVSPKYDSGVVTFFLTPIASRKHSRVIVEWFGDEQKNTLLGSLTLITDVVESQDNLSKNPWEMKVLHWDFVRAATDRDLVDSLDCCPPPTSQSEQVTGAFSGGQVIGGLILDKTVRVKEKEFNIWGSDITNLAGTGYIGGFPPDTANNTKVDHLPWPDSPDSIFSALELEPFSFTIAFLQRQPGPRQKQSQSWWGRLRQSAQPTPDWVIQRQSGQAYRYVETLPNQSRLELVAIPGGSFLMGSPENESDHQNEESPQHEVTLTPFFMGRYPITQAQWRTVASLPQVERELDPDPSDFKGDRRPVERVNWFDAMEFCARLSVYTGQTYTLPSEAQWEYACRAGTATPFHFGETISPELANYDSSYTYADGPKGEYRQETTPVDQFGVANPWGLSDMHGNVWEWCLDHYHNSYDGAPTDGTAWIDAEAGENKSRILRGGSWNYIPRNCRCAYRSYNYPVFRYFYTFSFRVVSVPLRALG